MESVLSSLPRLKKSGIEYVILAWSSLFTFSRAQSRHRSGLASSWSRTERDFVKGFDFSALEIAKFPGNSRNPEISLEIASTFSSALADFRGNFRNSHFSLARRFPAEFPETYRKGNPFLNVRCASSLHIILFPPLLLAAFFLLL